MNEQILIALAGIGAIGIAAQWFAWWVKLPAILFLLLAGILAGPVTGWLDPDALFGNLLMPMVSLAVAVILFEGSLTLKFYEIKGLETVVRRLVSSGILVTWVVTAAAAQWLVGFSWELAFLFGALTVVTGPTVIVPMLRTVRPNARLSNILRWEGIVIDPIGALLAVLVFELIISGQGASALGHASLAFVEILLVGGLLGIVAGYGLGIALRHHWIPEYLQNVATLCLVFAVFALSNVLAEESGLLAVTLMGMWLANMKNLHVEDILDFKESLSVLLISGLFIILAARMDPSQFQALGWGALGVFLAMQFIARPLKVAVAARGSDLTLKERALLSWIAPRGIVAAAISALFALRLEEQNLPQADLLVPLTFLIIIGTVALQSATSRPLARMLGVSEPDPRGVLIVGANPVARAMAVALRDRGFRTVLSDSVWENIREARMLGLDTYFGNPVSAHADRHLNLVGIGRLLALSPRPAVNALTALRYKSEFGVANVFRLAVSGKAESGGEDRHASDDPATVLFANDVTYKKLASLISQGAEIRHTPITESFSIGDYFKAHGKSAIPLFAIDPQGGMRPFVADEKQTASAGWSILGLIPKKAEIP